MSLHAQLAFPNLFASPENRLSPKPSSEHRRVSVRASSTANFMATETPSLYEVLRVKRTASKSEIKLAYRTLAKLYHPDSSSSAASDGVDFMAVHEAYATLADPAARAVYDLSIGAFGRRSEGLGLGFYSTRRWETDQCW